MSDDGYNNGNGDEDNGGGPGLVEYALILVLVAIVVMAALLVLGPIIGNALTSQTDPVAVSGTEISVYQEETAHPRSVNPVDLPKGDDLATSPRYWDVSGCLALRMPDEAVVLQAATPAQKEIADLIDIIMPLADGNIVTICAPDFTVVRVYLWVK